MFSLLHCLHTLYVWSWCFYDVEALLDIYSGRQGGVVYLFLFFHQSEVHWDMVLCALLYILFINIAAVLAALFALPA